MMSRFRTKAAPDEGLTDRGTCSARPGPQVRDIRGYFVLSGLPPPEYGVVITDLEKLA